MQASNLVKQIKKTFQDLQDIHQQMMLDDEGVGEFHVSEAAEHLNLAVCFIEDYLYKYAFDT